jgi:large subunit ribosomal protein L7/L12
VSTQEQQIENLVETLSKLSVLEMSKLKSALEDKWGVKAAAAAPMMMAAMPAAGGGAAAAETKEATEFKVTLQEAPADKRIGIIKVIREVTGLGLKEAKDLVEGAPKVIKETAPKAEADSIAKKVAEAGGKVTLAGL